MTTLFGVWREVAGGKRDISTNLFVCKILVPTSNSVEVD